MNVLVLGGTAFLGGEIARAAMTTGHEVTCLARGESGSAPDGVRFVRGDRSRPGAYAGLPRSGRWDLVVDLARQPGQVRSALIELADQAERWVFVSTGSVYADHSRHGAGLETPLLRAWEGEVATQEQYGAGKVACEAACKAYRGSDVLIARSGLIVGRGDPSDRFGYWPGRFVLAQADGGPVLVPVVTGRQAQAIDVLDLASWLVGAGLAGTTGIVDAYGPRRLLGDVLDVAREVAGFTGESVPVADEALQAVGVEEYMGPRSLPLWLHDPEWTGFNDRSTASATAAGLVARDLHETMHDALEWERHLGLGRTARRAGLDRDDELAVLAAT
ncbi:NAD-dependent epimerase/dehydratase family protein [Lapillicoccus sp.]|uniref:NAD-dependent epimerase/dehydratase family protein n=1 Tax=Lapillicoccus sp. TaxID=1909287 RepID=UPI003263D911